jgi:hypothetical protein
MMGFAWDSEEAADLNRRIFETIYYYATYESAWLGQRQRIVRPVRGQSDQQGRAPAGSMGRLAGDGL